MDWEEHDWASGNRRQAQVNWRGRGESRREAGRPGTRNKVIRGREREREEASRLGEKAIGWIEPRVLGTRLGNQTSPKLLHVYVLSFFFLLSLDFSLYTCGDPSRSEQLYQNSSISFLPKNFIK